MRAMTSTTSRTECCIALDHVGHLVGRLGRRTGERLDLLGDDREAAALGTGPAGLDGGVEGEQVGLLGDAADDGDGVADLQRRVAAGLVSTTSARSARVAASRAVVAASVALSATSRIEPESWAVPVATEATLSLTVRAALETLRAWLAVSSAEAASCWLTAESSCEALSTTLERPAISPRAPRMSPTAAVRAVTMRPTSSLPLLPKRRGQVTLGQPLEAPTQRSIGLMIERPISMVSRNSTHDRDCRAPISTTRSRCFALSADFLVAAAALSCT